MTATGITTSITREQVAALRAQVGVPHRRTYQEWELQDARVLRSQIRHWAVMTGDMRPLFLDPGYAASTPWKTLIAPAGVVACFEQVDPETESLPGCASALVSARVEWERPIRLGDTLLPGSTITAVRELPGSVVAEEITTEVTTPAGDLVGRAVLEWHCFERGSASQRALFGDRQDAHFYSRADIEALGAEYKAEKQRGNEPLYWDDVAAGQELAPVLKGPTTRTKYLGRLGSNWYWGHLQGWEASEQRPELFFRNENDAPEPVTAVDWVHHRAQRWGGLPGALEVSTERIHHFVHLLLNWGGDHSLPRALDLQFPIQNMVGDVTRSYGRVTGKTRERATGFVDLEVWQENQLGQRITTGTARVALPVRGA